jgi:hypothetical protein
MPMDIAFLTDALIYSETEGSGLQTLVDSGHVTRNRLYSVAKSQLD